jgi:hypothetical protein
VPGLTAPPDGPCRSPSRDGRSVAGSGLDLAFALGWAECCWSPAVACRVPQSGVPNAWSGTGNGRAVPRTNPGRAPVRAPGQPLTFPWHASPGGAVPSVDLVSSVPGPGLAHKDLRSRPGLGCRGLSMPGLGLHGIDWASLAWMSWPGLSCSRVACPDPAWPGLAFSGIAWPGLCWALRS